MNITATRGQSAYAQYSAIVRETARLQKSLQERDTKQEQTASSNDDPIDTVSISHRARSLSFS